MRFDHFSFASIRIDAMTYEHDVVIDRGEVVSARKSRRKNSATLSATRHYPWRRRYPGSAGGWWWVRERTEDCP